MRTVFEGCECEACQKARADHRMKQAGPHECLFNSGEQYPEHCVVCGLAVNDPRRHLFLRQTDELG